MLLTDEAIVASRDGVQWNKDARTYVASLQKRPSCIKKDRLKGKERKEKKDES